MEIKEQAETAAPFETTTATLTFHAPEVAELLIDAEQADRRFPSYVQRFDPTYRHDSEPFDREEEGREPHIREVDMRDVPPGLHLCEHGGMVYLTSNAYPLSWDDRGVMCAFARGYSPEDVPCDPPAPVRGHSIFFDASLFRGVESAYLARVGIERRHGERTALFTTSLQ